MELALGEQLNKRLLEEEKIEARSNQAKAESRGKLANLSSQALDQVEVVKKIKDVKKFLRIINAVFAISFAGLIVTWVIMSIQAFVGNLLGAKLIALEGLELGAYAILTFLILACLAIVFTLIAFAMNPWNLAVTTLEAGLDWIMGN